MKRKRSKKVTRFISTMTATALLIVSLLSGQMLEIQAASRTQNDAVSWANSQIGKGLDYDGVYGNQCVDLIKYYYAYFGVAGYAMGNANAYITNSLPSGWTRVYSNYQPGDIAVWKVNHSCSTCNTGSLGHVGIITSADSVGFNAVNQNFNNKSYCTQNWFYCSALACAIRPSYSSSSVSTPSISFADFSQNAVWDTNAEMYIKVMNPNRAVVSKAGCYLYGSNGSLLKSYTEDCGLSTSYVNYNCNINNDMKYTLTPGTTYKFVLFVIVKGVEYKDTMRSFTTTGSSDREKPVISDVSVYDTTEDGYKVKCKASDNVGVVRVQFPTWTLANGQDDIQADWGTSSLAAGKLDASGYYVYEVKRSDHNNELGDYLTHIYAYDAAGNYASAAASVVTLKERGNVEPQLPQNPDSGTTHVDGNTLADVAEGEYALYHGQEYNYIYGSSPWCSNFVSWCARKSGVAPTVIPSTATVQVMYDTLINNCNATVVTTPKRGDLVFYKYTDYDSKNYHHIGIMISENKTVQGNVSNTWWEGAPEALDNIKEMTFVRPAYNGEYVAPGTAYFTDYKLNLLENTNAETYIKIQNPNRSRVTEVGCTLYNQDDQVLKTYSESCNWSTSYVNYTCNFKQDMDYELSPGTVYKIVLYAVVDGTKIIDSARTFQTTGGTYEPNVTPAPTKTPNETSATAIPTETPDETNATAIPTKTPGNNSSDSGIIAETEKRPPSVSVKKPGKVKNVRVKNLKGQRVKVTWGSAGKNCSYQIQFARNRSFTKGKLNDFTSGRYMKYFGATKKKIYYVRVRAYRNSSGKKLYGKWSTVKKVKIKK